MTGTAISNTQVDFLSPIALNSVSATITLILPSGAKGSSALGQANLVAGAQTDAFAQDDAYSGVVGNVIYDSGTTSVLVNDFPGGCFNEDELTKPEDANARQLGLTIVTHDTMSANGGDVSMNNDGTFTYNPPPGFEGVDTFTYTMTDGNTQDVATVFMTVADMVWFIDNEAAPGGDGRLTNPFTMTTEMQAIQTNSPAIGQAENGDYIFYFGGTRAPYPTELFLLPDQTLMGNGIDLILQSQTIVPADTDAVLENLSLVEGVSANSGVVYLGDRTRVLGITVNGAAENGIVGDAVSGPILIDNVDVRNVGDDCILISSISSGTFTVGDPADGRSVIMDTAGSRGLLCAPGIDGAVSLIMSGCAVDNTGQDGILVLDANADILDCVIGRNLAAPAVSIVGHGISFQSDGTTTLNFNCVNPVVHNAGINGINIQHFAAFEGEGGQFPELVLPGVPTPIIGLDEINASISGASVGGCSNHGLFVSAGFLPQAIVLQLAASNSFSSAGTGFGVYCQGQGTDSIICTQAGDLTVTAGSAVSRGVLFEGCTFDADPTNFMFDQVVTGTWNIGEGIAPVEGTGLELFFPFGDLSISTLNIDCANGNGVVVETFGGIGTSFFFNVGGGTINAPDGVPTVIN